LPLTTNLRLLDASGNVLIKKKETMKEVEKGMKLVLGIN